MPLEKLSTRQSVTVGITLFSMFFGAGNLILPPLLGWQAGVESPAAMAGFLVAAIGLPVAGVVSCALAGDLTHLASRVHPLFATIFSVLVYLSIGPCLAIPRTASTSFEMLVPLLADSVDARVASAVFSVAFFAAAGLLALHPNRLTQLLGRITGPLLIALIVAVVGAAAILPLGEPQAARAPYDGAAALSGFVTGYQTMDLLASLTFGIIIAQNVRELGVSSDGGVAREVIRAGALMAVLMGLIYCGTAYVGVTLDGAAGAAPTNGAEVLTTSASAHFGIGGTIVVAIIFLLACLNVCIGLLSCCGAFFEELCSRVSYRMWVVGFAVLGCVVSNVGLDAIITFSVPLLSALYPMAIVLVLMGVARPLFDHVPLVWPWAVAAAGVTSVPVSLRDAFAPALTLPLDALPLANVGLGWVLPVLAGIAAGLVHTRLTRERAS